MHFYEINAFHTWNILVIALVTFHGIKSSNTTIVQNLTDIGGYVIFSIASSVKIPNIYTNQFKLFAKYVKYQFHACSIPKGCEDEYDTFKERLQQYQKSWIDQKLFSLSMEKFSKYCKYRKLFLDLNKTSILQYNFYTQNILEKFYENILIFTMINLLTESNQNLILIPQIKYIKLGTNEFTENILLPMIGSKLLNKMSDIPIYHNTNISVICMNGFGGPHCTFECSYSQLNCSFEKKNDDYFEKCNNNQTHIATIQHFSNKDACEINYTENITIFKCSNTGPNISIKKSNPLCNDTLPCVKWKELNTSFTLTIGDTINCNSIIDNNSQIMITMKQFSGPGDIDNGDDNSFIIHDGILPGYYVVACIVKIHKLSKEYYKFIDFEIKMKSNGLCISNFLPVPGVLIKCQYMESMMIYHGYGTYYLILRESFSKKIIKYVENGQYFELPFLLKYKTKYQLICNYTDYFSDKILFTHVEFELSDQTNSSNALVGSNCSQMITPESYDRPLFQIANNILFYSQYIYYTTIKNSNSTIIFLFIFILLVFILPIILILLININKYNKKETDSKILLPLHRQIIRIHTRQLNDHHKFSKVLVVPVKFDQEKLKKFFDFKLEND